MLKTCALTSWEALLALVAIGSFSFSSVSLVLYLASEGFEKAVMPHAGLWFWTPEQASCNRWRGAGAAGLGAADLQGLCLLPQNRSSKNLPFAMWSAGICRFWEMGSSDARILTNLFLNSCRFYSTGVYTKRPALYLLNSSTRAELFLMGIDHVSPKSAEIVQNLIKDVKPRVVAVELCEDRARRLMACKELERLGLWDFLRIKGTLGERIITYTLNNMYADLACTGLKPGEEQRVAIEQGKAVGAKVEYIDQDIKVTVQRAANNFSLRELFWYWRAQKDIIREYPTFFGALNHENLIDCAEHMLTPEALKEAIEVGERFFPGLVQVILHERNEHMVKILREMKGCIVCVVGAMHVRGMQKLWEEAERICERDRALPVAY